MLPNKKQLSEAEFLAGKVPEKAKTKVKGLVVRGTKIVGQMAVYVPEADFVRYKEHCMREGLEMSQKCVELIREYLNKVGEG